MGGRRRQQTYDELFLARGWVCPTHYGELVKGWPADHGLKVERVLDWYVTDKR